MQDSTTNGAPRRKLSDILNSGGDTLRDAWASTEAAEDFAPLPSGTYQCRVDSGELATARTGTASFKMKLRVIEGEHVGRLVWHDVWLTPAAMAMAKRDLLKLGISELEQLERPLPKGIRCSVKITLRTDDDGTQHNRVKGFEVVGIDESPAVDDDFAPDASPSAGEGSPAPSTPEVDAAEGGPTKTDGQLIDTTPRPRWAQECGR